MAIDVGEGITIKATFKDVDGNVVDPATPVTLVVSTRGDNQTQITCSKVSTGVFEGEYKVTTAGVHYYTFYTAGTPPGIQQGTFTAKQVIAEKS